MSDQQPTRQFGGFMAIAGQKPWPPMGTFLAVVRALTRYRPARQHLKQPQEKYTCRYP